MRILINHLTFINYYPYNSRYAKLMLTIYKLKNLRLKLTVVRLLMDESNVISTYFYNCYNRT